MPDNLTAEVIATSGPLVIETFLKHYLGPRKSREDAEGQETARVDLMYDEVFSLAKSFLATASNHTANALQKFGQTWTPSPPTVAVHRLVIPHHSLILSADYLIKAFGGEEMAFKVAGGTKWWQVRANAGVEAEWICMKKQYHEALNEDKEKSKKRDEVPEDSGFLPEMNRMRCMLYIHGGAYYWGSINTHRYVIWRFARKMRGRCFAVNYRKAPQYPFPCAIQDCLAAWLYLVNPPPGAEHRPVPPKNIIIAGDSAGGGLVWSLLQILRDTPGLELPAGAVLISPWSDLTHSFPSILQNTKTDVIPPYGFLHKPSSLWPPPPPALTEEMQSRIVQKAKGAVSRMRGRDDHLDGEQQPIRIINNMSSANIIRTSELDTSPKLKDLLKKRKVAAELAEEHPPVEISMTNPAAVFSTLKHDRESADRGQSSLAQTTQPLYMDILGERLAIDTQIQLYATNAQLCHPWVSPILGYLGGLPPLYILAGDKEVLRDEIIYAAHKAAHPDKHPIREDVRQLLPTLKGIETKYGPTNVHLQVYDGVGHDLPLFSMTSPSRGAFRAIASFCRYVTPSQSLSVDDGTPQSSTDSAIDLEIFRTAAPEELGSRTPSDASVNIPPLIPLATPTPGAASTPAVYSPSLHIPPVETGHLFTETPGAMTPPVHRNLAEQTQLFGTPAEPMGLSKRLSELRVEGTGVRPPKPSPPSQPKHHVFVKSKTLEQGHLPPRLHPTRAPSGDDAGPRFREQDSKAKPGTAGYIGVYAGRNPFTDHMIRERVDLDGVIRPLEPPDELGALRMPADAIGKINEGAAMRYVEGQSIWDHKFKRVKRRVKRHRARNLTKSREHDTQKIMARWHEAAKRSLEMKRRSEENRREGRLGSFRRRRANTGGTDETSGTPPTSETESESDAHDDSRFPFPDTIGPMWGVQWALNDEAPPPSAIVSRRDLPEGRQLALMADSLCSESTSTSGLSLWVLFATMFSSSSSERGKTADALKEAKDLRAQEKRQRRVKKAEKEEEKERQKSLEIPPNAKGKGREPGNRMVNGTVDDAPINKVIREKKTRNRLSRIGEFFSGKAGKAR